MYDISTFLLESIDKNLIVHDIDILSLLLDQGYNIDTKDDIGWTYLMNVCIYRKNDIAELLLNNGANPYICSEHDNDSLSITCLMNNELYNLIQNEYAPYHDNPRR